jgi:hypothetical protein
MKPTIAVDHEKQLILLRDLTARMGVIHEAQQLQLKMWPIVLFTHGQKFEERVDVNGKEVDFIILQTKGKKPDDMDKRFEHLNDWTKWLLGDDWLIRVKLRDKVLYRGMRRVALRNKVEPVKVGKANE